VPEDGDVGHSIAHSASENDGDIASAVDMWQALAEIRDRLAAIAESCGHYFSTIHKSSARVIHRLPRKTREC
jgi:hypothetical protein